MTNKGNEKEEKIRYAIPLGGDPPLYIDSEASDEGTLSHASKLREQSSLMRGLILGLLFGIIGNVFVSHYYEVFRVGITMVFGEGSLHFANVLMTWIYLGIIIIFSWHVYKVVKALDDTSVRLEAHVTRKGKHLNSIKEAQDNGKSGDVKDEG